MNDWLLIAIMVAAIVGFLVGAFIFAEAIGITRIKD